MKEIAPMFEGYKRKIYCPLIKGVNLYYHLEKSNVHSENKKTSNN